MKKIYLLLLIIVALAGTIGTETSFKRITIGANFQTPLQQNLGRGIIKANDRCMVHVSFTL